MTEILKHHKKFKESSKRWLKRQINDPYVRQAQKDGYRSRAAYKLLELQNKTKLIKPGMNILDVGAAPGGWSQVVAKIVGKKGHVVAIDLLPMDPLPGVSIFQGDFETHMFESVGCFHGVLSDMAPSSCGISHVDHIRLMVLLESFVERLPELLAPGGFFIAKVLQGGTEPELLKKLRKNFQRIQHCKPPASRSGSCEMYVIGTQFMA